LDNKITLRRTKFDPQVFNKTKQKAWRRYIIVNALAFLFILSMYAIRDHWFNTELCIFNISDYLIGLGFFFTPIVTATVYNWTLHKSNCFIHTLAEEIDQGSYVEQQIKLAQELRDTPFALSKHILDLELTDKQLWVSFEALAETLAGMLQIKNSEK
jgi:folate-dependent phosphoribosylglycinamide formyltransferase PurN